MEAYDWLAKLYEAQNDMSAAQETLENAVQLVAAGHSPAKELAEVAVQNHDYDTAERALKNHRRGQIFGLPRGRRLRRAGAGANRQGRPAIGQPDRRHRAP